jgi:thiol-disulfide isomerase/thioredoxin
MRSLVVLSIFIWALASFANAEDTAGSAWTHLQELNDRAHEKVPTGTNAVEFYAGPGKALHDAAEAFVNQFPADVHRPQAMLWMIQETYFPESVDQRIALLHHNELEAAPIVADTTLSADLRFQIQRTIINQWLDNSDLITTSEQAAGLEDRIAELVQKNPDQPKAVSLQLARANLMLRFDRERGLELLQELAQAPDQNLAGLAKARLLKAKMIGKPVDLQFTTLDGSAFDMKALRGKVVLVDFWASWCPDCIREMPAVRKTYQKYKDKGFAIVGISFDQDVQALSGFVAKKLIPWPQYFDGRGWESELAVKYDVRAIPEMWLINQRGEVVRTDITVEELDRTIDQLMSAGDRLSRN